MLIVLQGMDTAGKDGAISHIFSGINPQGCDVASFKIPTSLEARHDFLWRCHAQGPSARHDLRLQPLALRAGARRRASTSRSTAQQVAHKNMQEINDFESMLCRERHRHPQVLPPYLQGRSRRSRLQSRLDDPNKLWKFSENDTARARCSGTSTRRPTRIVLSHALSRKHAPWFVIPARTTSGTATTPSPPSWCMRSPASNSAYPKPTVDPTTIKL